MKLGYARVSTRDQNLDLQVDALTGAGCERIYQDVASGSQTTRPALEEMLAQVRAGDVLVIWYAVRSPCIRAHGFGLGGDNLDYKGLITNPMVPCPLPSCRASDWQRYGEHLPTFQV
ncbi:MAG: recombinase family protein [Gammaproteobacteria bacterium]|nr:recombinase family protein [Gammaproteobacteria bacterium]